MTDSTEKWDKKKTLEWKSRGIVSYIRKNKNKNKTKQNKKKHIRNLVNPLAPKND